MVARVPEHGRSEEQAVGAEHLCDVPDRRRLADHRARQAMEHQVHPDGAEWTPDGQGLEHVGFDRCDVQPAEALRGAVQDVEVRVEDRDLAALRESGMLEEVAGPGPDIEVIGADVPAVVLEQPFERAVPHPARRELQHERVVEPERERGEVALALVRRIAVIQWHRRSMPSATLRRALASLDAEDRPSLRRRPLAVRRACTAKGRWRSSSTAGSGRRSTAST